MADGFGSGEAADNTLDQHDLRILTSFVAIAAFEIDREIKAERNMNDACDRIITAVQDHQLTIVYQPIWNAETMQPVGFESLSRFAQEPVRSPDKWFAEATDVGLGPMLEIEAIRLALEGMPQLPAPLYLAVNASPGTILGGDFAALFTHVALDRVVVEITEHSTIGNYEELHDALRPLRERGMRLAIDDAGAGYCSLRHILAMRPEFIKLDISLTQNIDCDPARRALARALIGFAADTGCAIIAEGVERESEFASLRGIGIGSLQGYLLGRPMSLAAALTLCLPRKAGKTDAA
jgi:EAL domain-containing protein (putative c-di-GMP-specific phosphodiesterase class I)